MGSYSTVSPLPRSLFWGRRGGLFSVALSSRSPSPGVTRHPALWSSDFPPASPVVSRVAGDHLFRCDARTILIGGFLVEPDPTHRCRCLSERRGGHASPRRFPHASAQASAARNSAAAGFCKPDLSSSPKPGAWRKAPRPRAGSSLRLFVSRLLFVSRGLRGRLVLARGFGSAKPDRCLWWSAREREGVRSRRPRCSPARGSRTGGRLSESMRLCFFEKLLRDSLDRTDHSSPMSCQLAALAGR